MYFEGLDAYDVAANTTSVLPLFLVVGKKMLWMKKSNPEEDQVFLANYIRKFVKNVLHKVDCMLNDKITN